MFNVESEGNMAKKVLVVDDEKLIVKGIRFSLEQDGMEVDCAYDGEEALSLASSNQYDVILLDVMLPKLTGFEVCQQIRESSDVPIIMLTAKGEDMDKILGLEYGADDYITKPFHINELLARVRVALRKKTSDVIKTKVFTMDTLKIDFEKYKVFVEDKEIHMTPIEYKLLVLLVENAGKVLTHSFIIRKIWGYSTTEDSQSLRVFMANIRRKIEKDSAHPRYIITEVGVGYRFVES